jgi:putative protease
MGVSGRCLISNFLSNRGANQGECSQSCRWDYKVFLEEKTREGEFFEIYEEDGYSHILSSKDLCLMPVLDKYQQIGIDSFKIEGRHKNAFYIASVARAYRLAIDNAQCNYMEMLNSVKNRGYTLGFHNGSPSELSTDYESTKSLGEYQFAGIVRSCDANYIILEVRNTLDLGDELEFLRPKSCENIKITLDKIIDAKSGKEIERASAGQGFCIKISDERLKNIEPFSVAKIECKAEDIERIYKRNMQFGRETEVCEV